MKKLLKGRGEGKEKRVKKVKKKKKFWKNEKRTYRLTGGERAISDLTAFL